MPFSLQPRHLSCHSYYTQTPLEYKRLLVRARLSRDGLPAAEISRLAMPDSLCYRRKDIIVDDLVKNPISALRFIPLSLRRTSSAPHSTGFARLELGLFTKPSVMMFYFEFIVVCSRSFSAGHENLTLPATILFPLWHLLPEGRPRFAPGRPPSGRAGPDPHAPSLYHSPGGMGP